MILFISDNNPNAGEMLSVTSNVNPFDALESAQMGETKIETQETVEEPSDYAKTTDENYEEQGFLWMCGICENQPTFETIYDLFDHKKSHASTKVTNEASSKVSIPESKVDSYSRSPSPEPFDTSQNDNDSLPNSPLLVKTEDISNNSPPSPSSSDDIPLANLSSKLNSQPNKKKFQMRRRKKKDKEAKVKVEESLEEINDENLVEEPDPIGNEASEKDVKEETSDVSEPEENTTKNNKWKKTKSKHSSDEGSSKPKVKHFCKICNSEFPTRFALSAHKKTHLYKDTGCYKCETCGKMCPKYDNFTRHLTIHFENREKSHQCGRCFASFYNLADLKRHLVLHLAVKPYTCEHCGEGFTRQDNLLIHAYKHTGVQYKKFACKDCDKVLNSPSALVMHVKTHSVKTVFCPEPDCKFSCYLQSQLRQHLRKHSGEKPFQCAKCGRCFARSNDMKNHVLNVHEGVKPFKCPACPKEFALAGNLRIHYTTHTNERPYLCAQCGKSFNHPSTLRKHSVIMHNPWRTQNKQQKSRRSSLPTLGSPPRPNQNSELKKQRKSKDPADKQNKPKKGKTKNEAELQEPKAFLIKAEKPEDEFAIATATVCPAIVTAQEVHREPQPVQIPQITVQIDPGYGAQAFVLQNVILEPGLVVRTNQ